MIVSLAPMNETPHMQQDDLRDDLTGSSLAVDIFSRRLVQSCVTSFIDAEVDSDSDLRVDVLCNVPGQRKVLDDIETELKSCTRFDIAVAFITLSGLTPLLQTLDELKKKDKPVHGRVLTTDYLTFSEPAAIRRLMSLDNIETRIYGTRDGAADGFHTKGWLFEREDVCRFIIGSSNLTEKALSVSHEWNTRLVCRESGAFAKKIRHEFEELWNHPQSRPARDVIDAYQIAWDQRVRERPPVIRPAVQALPEPNVMQQRFLEKLDQCLAEGRKRALLISATGTGKTYAAAFAVRRMAPSRVLFLVHREQIARQAMASFQRVLGGPDEDFGLLGGGVNQADRKYVFATVQTVMRRLDRPELAPGTFDVIIVDEVHRAGAEGYRTVMDHFAPRFWLGMTGSPDRTDGENIYDIFDHNIVYEIRLQAALENDLLCPFHYFGISDVSVLQDNLQEKSLGKRDFLLLESDEMARRVLEKSRYYGWSGPRVKALVFCSGLRRAEETADALVRQGARALAVSGDSDMTAREDAIRRLTQDEGPDCLDYLVTVDIFNEGVDIPEVNQIILMRPTKSAIVFIQQLGRGLRKHPGKDFTVVLDFIANCDSNYLIPAALTGDRTCSRENLRRAVAVEKRRIPGISSIHFDKKAREAIYKAIDRASIGGMKRLEEWYLLLKYKLGRIPSLLDFEEHGEVDAVKYLERTTGWSYHRFLRSREKDYQVVLTDDADRRIAWIGRKLGTGLRPSEAMVLEEVLDRALRESGDGGQEDLSAVLADRLREECGFGCTELHLGSVAAMLTNNFESTQAVRQKNEGMTFIKVRGDGAWEPDPAFVRTLREDAAFAPMVRELLTFILRRWRRLYVDHPRDTRRLYADHARDTLLCLGRVYTYEDVCRMLDWDRLMPAQNIGGYFYDDRTKTLPIFINYAKTQDAIAYEDRFLSRAELVHFSKPRRGADSEDAKRMMRRPGYEDIRAHLFVRRSKFADSDGEGSGRQKEIKGFYYLGEMDPAGEAVETRLPGSGAKVFRITWRLRRPVEPGLYEYLTGEEG